MKFFKIWRKLPEFDSLHHYQYFILILISEKKMSAPDTKCKEERTESLVWKFILWSI